MRNTFRDFFLFTFLESLVSHQREALEGNHLQLLVLSAEPLSYSSLVAVAELELLVNEAVLLEELGHAALGNVLNHLCGKAGSLLSRNSGDDFLCLGNVLGCDPALGHVALHVVFAVHVGRVDAGLLQGVVNSLAHLLFLGLLNSHLVLLVEDALRH